MNDNEPHDLLRRIMLAAGAMEQLVAEFRQQSQHSMQSLETAVGNASRSAHALQSQAVHQLQQQAQEGRDALRTARQQEEASFRQAMVALFQEQQRQVQAELRPAIVRAWQTLGVLAGVFVLLFAAIVLLLKHESGRLKLAEARADAAVVNADVQRALQDVQITSCGGRACIKVDKNASRWGRNGEYVLVDVRAGKHAGQGRK